MFHLKRDIYAVIGNMYIFNFSLSVTSIDWRRRWFESVMIVKDRCSNDVIT